MLSAQVGTERQTEPFVGNVHMEWFQTLDAVTFTFYVKNRLASDVKVNVSADSFEVVIKLDAHAREYRYEVEHFYGELDTEKGAEVTVKSMKVEVKLTKAKPLQWPSLERDINSVPVITAASAAVSLPQAAAASAAVASSHEAQSSSAPSTKPSQSKPNKKDWSSFTLDEEDDKADGEDALNKLFKQIYGNGTDDQRRAMIKSFTESGGTVLSTNWDDVGLRKVAAEPPKGMEAKRMSE